MNIIERLIYENIIPTFGWLFHCKNKNVNVLYYHDIIDGPGYSFMRVEKELFYRQMQYLVDNGYRTITFAELELDQNLAYDKKTVLITFDDGWKSNYSILEYMKSKGLKYNVFLTMGEIDHNPDYLTWHQVREMKNSGIVGFGAHTYSHPSMKDLSMVDLPREIDEANNLFKEKLGYFPYDFCYPFGARSIETDQYITEKTQYLRVYTTSLMYSHTLNAKVLFGRCGISNDESFRVYRNKVKGYYNIWTSLMRQLHVNK